MRRRPSSGTGSGPAQAALLLMLLALAAGCGDDPAAPDPTPPALKGRVLDAQGAPVEGAHLNLVYRLVGEDRADLPLLVDPVTAPPREIDFELQAAQAVQLALIDRHGEVLRLLVHGVLPAGMHSVILDWRDEGAAPLPNGLYEVVLVRDPLGEAAAETIGAFFIHSGDPDYLASTAQALSDEDGRFAIPLAGLPVGATVVDDPGGAPDTLTVLSQCDLVASLDALTFVTVGVDLGDLGADVTVEFALPPTIP